MTNIDLTEFSGFIKIGDYTPAFRPKNFFEQLFIKVNSSGAFVGFYVYNTRADAWQLV